MILIYVEFSCKYRTITEMQQVLDRERKITQVTNQLKEMNKGPKRKKISTTRENPLKELQKEEHAAILFKEEQLRLKL